MKIIGERLSNETMLKVKGGTEYFVCWCGHENEENWDEYWYQEAPGIQDALNYSNNYCNGQGGGCDRID